MLEVFICIAIVFSFGVFHYNKKKDYLKEIERLKEDKEFFILENKTLENIKEKSERELWQLQEKIKPLYAEEEKIKIRIEEKTSQLEKTIQLYSSTTEDAKRNMDQALQLIAERTQEKIKSAEMDYRDLYGSMGVAYEEAQDRLIAETAVIRSELDKISSTRTAAIKAALKEKKIEEDPSFYSLSIEQNDLDDIKLLERIKDKLHQPRVLCMLIWSTYYQKPMSQLCSNILGGDTISGIYKITNLETKECYIGQAVDVAKRWKDHAKCGLGIDTPATNKLYKAMKEYGLYNFSWELIERCSKENLNEKEKAFIEIYSSKDYGYNSTAGNKKVSI